jgi:lipopolysaccharide/colanic/teichoic acid biosynthesis glycosyltransferase
MINLSSVETKIMNNIIQMKDKQLLNDSLELSARSVAFNTWKQCKTECDVVFDKPCFLEQLRFEQQRTQRSKTALSILLLTQDIANEENFRDNRDLIKTLRTKIRETDIVGYIAPCIFGVLLPYTDEEGAKRISEKIMGGFSAPSFSIASSTYPDKIFDSLANTGCVSPTALGLMLEDSINKSRLQLFLKRAVDIVGSISALLILSPMMLLTALFIKVSSPGPIIFRQTRLGKKGIPFTFYKFRSMRTDTSDQIHRDYVLKLIDGNHSVINNGNDEKPFYKIKSDPRITPVGKFIRKTSIDELPQFYNVLKGDMSLVGPRPPLAYEAEKYQAWHLRRILEMKPGITGLWQVEGRSRTGFDEAVRLDIRYLKTWSLSLDIKILLKTVLEVVRCRGAG